MDVRGRMIELLEANYRHEIENVDNVVTTLLHVGAEEQWVMPWMCEADFSTSEFDNDQYYRMRERPK